MRKTTCTCDRCGKEITEGVVFSLTCYAEDVACGPFMSSAAAAQNVKQNKALMVNNSKELCLECKDALTDGLFIV